MGGAELALLPMPSAAERSRPVYPKEGFMLPHAHERLGDAFGGHSTGRLRCRLRNDPLRPSNV